MQESIAVTAVMTTLTRERRMRVQNHKAIVVITAVTAMLSCMFALARENIIATGP